MTIDNEKTIAQKLFEADRTRYQLEELLDSAGVQFEDIGWDYYDCSIELFQVPSDYRLDLKAQKTICQAGFSKAYLNHTNDHWETHYSWNSKAFVESKGWRISRPYKRGDEKGSIWLEEVCENWPKDWYESGKVKVVDPSKI